MAWNYTDPSTDKATATLSIISSTTSRQSPIDLTEKFEKFQTRELPLKLVNYHEHPKETCVKNTGDTIRLTAEWHKYRPSIRGPCLESPDYYGFFNAHVHWSSNNANGTEHSINSRRFSTELHIVHLNCKYKTPHEAMRKADGIAVLGILFEVKDHAFSNPGMERLALLSDAVKNTKKKLSTPLPFDLSGFFPKLVHSVYAYDGSLTTPPYSENVRWVVLAEPQYISLKAMNNFRKVHLQKNARENVRSLQPINERVVRNYVDH